MARPQTVTDEEILAAAHRVITRRGYDSFALSDVAAEVGLSRAAIILRFKSTHDLRSALTHKMNMRYISELNAQEVERSGDGLLSLCAFIAGAIASVDNYAGYLVIFRVNITETALAEVERERTEALRAAIAVRMPATVLSKQASVLAFEAMLQGAVMQWASLQQVPLREHLLQRAKDWLTLAGIETKRGQSKRVAARR